MEPEDVNDEPELIIDEPEIKIKSEIKEQTITPPPRLNSQPSIIVTATKSPELNSLSTDQKYCKKCDIKFNYYSTFIAHKKFYCKSEVTERDTGSSPTQPNVVANRATESVL